MKFLTVSTFGSIMLLIAGMAGTPGACAHEGEEPGMESHLATESPGEGGSTQEIPETAEGIWQAIDQHAAELEKVIQGGMLDKVHHLAFAIRDLAAALPEHSQGLPADKLAQVKGSVKFVATLAERLDTTGDANDMAGTRANFDKLKEVLDGMRASYQKGSSS